MIDTTLPVLIVLFSVLFAIVFPITYLAWVKWVAEGIEEEDKRRYDD